MAKILNVFYGADNLPYKDKERTVHFPIVGNAFQGASDTTEIRFYFDRIGEPNTSWVAVSKLPNGKIGSKVLQVKEDTTLDEEYALLKLSSFYTQYKGDLFISLQGYAGEVQVEYDEENELYVIKGTPTIQATGSVKLAINYATQFVGSGEETNADLQAMLGLLGTKLNISSGIVVLADLANTDLSSYLDGQLIYDKTTNLYYQKTSGGYVLANTNGLLGNKGAIAKYTFDEYDTLGDIYQLIGANNIASLTIEGLEYLVTMGSNSNLFALDLLSNDYYSYTGGVNGQATELREALSDTYKHHIATKDYVEAYTYDRETIDTNISTYVSNYTYNKETIDLKDSTKVDKLTSPNSLPRVYGYEGSVQTSYATDNNNGDQMVYNALVKRNATGQIRVPTTPTNNNHATSKTYVDTTFGVAIDLSIDENYDLVVRLLNANGVELSRDDIDLPLESIVVSAQYYETYTYDGQTYSKVIVIVLATTNVPTIIPVGDILSGVVNVSDIVDNLTSYDIDKPLSANQGRALKALIDALDSAKANASDVYTKNETYNQEQADAKFRTETQVDDQIDSKFSGLSRVNLIQDLEENKNYDYKFIVNTNGELILRLTEIE